MLYVKCHSTFFKTFLVLLLFSQSACGIRFKNKGILDEIINNISSALQIPFYPNRYYPFLNSTNGGAEDGDLADFNGDGFLDYVGGGSSAYLYLGNGDGTFRFGAEINSGSIDLGTIAVDLNTDGFLDVVTAHRGANTTCVNMGITSVTFGAATCSVTGTNPRYLIEGDFNEDGNNDVLVSNRGTNLTMMLGDGSGGFSSITGAAFCTRCGRMATGYINNDTHLDVVVADDNADVIHVLLGDGLGGFALTNYAIGSRAFAIQLVDINNDTYLDIGYSGGINLTSTGKTGYLYNTGTGAGLFGADNNTSHTDWSYGIAFTDWDFDGFIDLLYTIRSPLTWHIKLNNGAGTFLTASNHTSANTPRSIHIGDLNNDGRDDITITGGGGMIAQLSGSSVRDVNRFTAPLYPWSIDSDDIDGDGDIDLIGLNQSADNISIYTNDGTGDFSSRSDGAAIFSYGETVQMIDINNDGHKDVVALDNGADVIRVMLWTAPGVFAAATSYATDSSPWRMVAGYFNNDAFQDLAVVCQGANTVSILIANGTGGYNAPLNFSTTTYAQGITSGDFNSDGNIDLAVIKPSDNEIEIYTGNGAGGFSYLSDLATSGSGTPLEIASGDFNGDGRLDLWAIESDFNESRLMVYSGNGNGTFTATTNASIAYGANASTIKLKDLNADNIPDMIASFHNGSLVALAQGKTNGDYSNVVYYSAGFGGNSVTINDFDNDGIQDIAVIDDGILTINVLMGYR